jgi:hypothetical protein
MTDLTLTEFLFERFAEDEVVAQNALVLYAPGSSGYADHYNPARVLAECEKNRRIVALHESWPTLVETPLETEITDDTSTDPAPFTFPSLERGYGVDGYMIRVSKQIAWLTTREYVARFGTDPPTAPILALLALPYADHPDCLPEWLP